MRIITLLLSVAMATPALAAQSIVGTWVLSEASCKSGPENKIAIGPMSIQSDVLNCAFGSVSRQGRLVRWEGLCHTGEGDERGPGTMTAQLTAGRLTMSGAGISLGPLKRCS